LQAWDRLFYDRDGTPVVYTAATIPPQFPHVRPFWGLFPQAIPVVYLASGVLTLDERRLRFVPKEYRFLGNKHVGLLQELEFELSLDEIQARGRYTLKSPVATTFDMTFARLSTPRPGVLSELCLAVGYTGLNMRGAKRRNLELLAALGT
jgi:hypothetical protein